MIAILMKIQILMIAMREQKRRRSWMAAKRERGKR